MNLLGMEGNFIILVSFNVRPLKLSQQLGQSISLELIMMVWPNGGREP